MEWSAGGWFGGQIGATVWMLVAGSLAAILEPATGLLVVGLFVVPNVLGFALWRIRRLSCYASTQVLIVVAAVCSLMAVWLLDRAGVWAQIQTGGQVAAGSMYWIIGLVFGGLVVMVRLRFGGDRNRSG